MDLDNILGTENVRKLTEMEANLSEGQLTIEEIGQALKQMKNHKSPQIDGFPAEFF